MRYTGKDIKNVFLMPHEVVSHLSQCDAELLRVLIYLFAADTFDEAEAAKVCGIGIKKLRDSVTYWKSVGLIEEDTEKKRFVADESRYAPRSYSSGEIADAIDASADFRSLIEYAEKRFGKIFNPTELSQLYGLVDYALIPCDMLMAIVDYCAENGKCSVRYLEKTALSIYDEGIDTYEKLEDYFEKKRIENEGCALVRSVIGAGSRAFTASEKAHIRRWTVELRVERELIEKAYERTINNIQKPSVSYMSKIIEGWYQNGVTTAEELRRQTEKKAEDELPFELDAYIMKPDKNRDVTKADDTKDEEE